MVNPGNLANLLVIAPTHRYGNVAFPPAAQTPPTDQDVVEAMLFKTRVLTQFNSPTSHQALVNEAGLSASAQYEHATIGVAAGRAVPPWFIDYQKQVDTRLNRLDARMNRKVNRVNARLNRMDTRLSRMQTKLNLVTARTTKLAIKAARADNGKYAIDNGGPFAEVPFPDGKNPWGRRVRVDEAVVQLPPLDNLAAVNALTDPEAMAYHRGYYPDIDPPHLLAQRCEAIERSIGRPAQ